MQDYIAYAKKNGITLETEGDCQLCGSKVSRGVFECHENAHHITDILDFNNPAYYLTRFLSVDAMALQHCEIHGPLNNHIHLTRLFLIFEKKLSWEYSKTSQLSNIINRYKKNKTEYLDPPPPKQRGKFTTSDLIKAGSAEEIVVIVRNWANDVYNCFSKHHALVSSIGETFISKYCR
jgi:hypothetical protein